MPAPEINLSTDTPLAPLLQECLSPLPYSLDPVTVDIPIELECSSTGQFLCATTPCLANFRCLPLCSFIINGFRRRFSQRPSFLSQLLILKKRTSVAILFILSLSFLFALLFLPRIALFCFFCFFLFFLPLPLPARLTASHRMFVLHMFSTNRTPRKEFSHRPLKFARDLLLIC